jgi:hypothetical protein
LVKRVVPVGHVVPVEPLAAAQRGYDIFDPRGRVAPEAQMYPLNTQMATNMAPIRPPNLAQPQFGQVQAANSTVKQQTQTHHQPENNQSPAQRTFDPVGRWNQRKLELHGQGLCVQCGGSNPDLSKIECPECLDAKGRSWREHMARFR